MDIPKLDMVTLDSVNSLSCSGAVLATPAGQGWAGLAGQLNFPGPDFAEIKIAAQKFAVWAVSASVHLHRQLEDGNPTEDAAGQEAKVKP